MHMHISWLRYLVSMVILDENLAQQAMDADALLRQVGFFAFKYALGRPGVGHICPASGSARDLRPALRAYRQAQEVDTFATWAAMNTTSVCIEQIDYRMAEHVMKRYWTWRAIGTDEEKAEMLNRTYVLQQVDDHAME